MSIMKEKKTIVDQLNSNNTEMLGSGPSDSGFFPGDENPIVWVFSDTVCTS